MRIGFLFRWHNALRRDSAVVFGEAILPVEEFGDRLGLYPKLDTMEAGEQQVHLSHQSNFGPLALASGLHNQFDLPSMALKQPPALRQLARINEPARRHVEALAAKPHLWVFAKRFVAVGKEVRARDLALDHNRPASAFPSNCIWRLACIADLFRQDDAAAIAA